MEKTSFKKSLLISLYLKAILNTPFIYKEDRKNIISHKNTFNALNTLLFNKEYQSDVFGCVNNLKEEDFIKTNIEIYDAYQNYNDLILNINPQDLSYKETVLKLRDLLDKQKNDADITYEEMLEQANLYYNSLPDKDIRDIFNRVYKERDKNIIVGDETANTFLMPTIDYALIVLGTESETYKNMLYDLIHEYGHVIQTNFNRDLLYYGKEYQPAELMPVFFTILSLFYFDSLENNIERNITNMQTSIFLNQVKYTKEIKENGIDAFKEKYNDAAIDIYFEHSLLQVYSYLIPMLTSFELLNNYKEDPEKAMHIIKKLVMNDKDFIDLLNDNKIHLGEHTNETVKMLKK